MTVNYQFGNVDAHGATIRAQAASPEAGHQAIVRVVLAAGDFWGGAGSAARQEQTAGSNMASTDSAVGSSWG